MDLFQWLLQASESAQVVRVKSSNTELFLLYVVVSICIKKPQLLSAFFMSCLLFECSFFDTFTEGQLYLITFIIYSYVMFCNGFNADTRAACVIMCLLCVVLAYDAAFYGVEGFYGVHETVVYNHIEHLVICCHILIIYSTIKIRTIGNNIRNCCRSIVRMSRHSVNFTIV